MNNPQARPALKDTKADVTDLKGKTLVPFATSGGSGITGSVRELRRAYPDLEWREGRLLNGASQSAIQNWSSDL